jgi:hypothetical protein
MARGPAEGDSKVLPVVAAIAGVLAILCCGCGGIGGAWWAYSRVGADGNLTVPIVGIKIPVKRLLINPGTNTGLPWPAPAITSKNCEDVADGGPVNGPGCITSDISCGDIIVGHTAGGVRRMDSKFYEKKFCTPYTTNHDGGEERVYRLKMPPGEWRAYAWLDTPCADLDLFAVKWDGNDCPTIDHNIQRCEASVDAWGWGKEAVELVHQGNATWFLVVEGKGDEEGAFALQIQCREGLQ